MSHNVLRYLEREHARLDALIDQLRRRPWPDETEIARLKKTKLLVKDQIANWRAEAMEQAA
jgi:hypothetical protein